MENRRIGPDGGFIREFKDWQKRVQSIESKPAGKITIRETLTTVDPETGVKTIIGELPDGSYGIQPFVYDITPPPVASTPTASAEPGLFAISWDGTFVDGAEQPRDFVAVNVIGHKIVNGTTASSIPVGRMTTAAKIYVSTDVVTVGETWEFSLEAEDYNGNRAEWSARSVPLLMKSLATDVAVETALADLQESTQAAQNAAVDAQEAATTAQDAADEAAQAALDANGIAEGKGKVLVQSGTPTVADQLVQNLWIDTTGGLNTPKRWNTTLSRWDAVTDKVATDAAAAAGLAQQKADEAFNNATNAAEDAGNAQETADGKGRLWYQDDQPAGIGHNIGDTWFDTNDNYKIRTWNGSIWQTTQDSWLAQQTADSKGITYTQSTVPPVEARLPQNLWNDTSLGLDKVVVKYWSTTAGAWTALTDKAATEARVVADSKGETIYSNTEPTVAQRLSQNLWIDTTGGININKRWDGSAWVVVADTRIASTATAVTAADAKAQTALNTATAKSVVYTQSTTPPVEARLPQTLWNDTSLGLNNIVVKYWDTTLGQWTALADKAATDAATAAANAMAAQAYSKNASFDEWAVGTYPVGFGTFGTINPVKETSLVRRAPFAVRFNVPDTSAQSGMVFTSPLSHAPNLEYFTVEMEFQLVSGGLGGAGMILDWAGLTNNRAQINLASEVSSPILGKWYYLTKTLRRPTNATGTWTNMSGYLMGQWSGHGAGAAKNIVFDWFNVRPATTEEITSYGAPAKYTELANATAAKGEVIYSDAEPAVAKRLTQNLWVDTTGGINLHKRWNGSAWVTVADSRIATTAAEVSALATQVTEVSAQADRSITTFFGTSTPATPESGDIWLTGVAGEPMKRYNGSIWQTFEDPNVQAAFVKAGDAQAAADGKVRTFAQDAEPTGMVPNDVGDIWIDTNDKNKMYRYSGAAWVAFRDGTIQDAQNTATDALNTAVVKTKTYMQDDQPPLTGNTIGDTWFDSNFYNKPHIWTGSAWVSAQDGTIALAQASADNKIETYYAATAPAGLTAINTGDLWIDSDDGSLSRWTGSAWVLVNDNGATKVAAKFSDLGIDQSWVDNIETQSDKAITTFFGATTPVGAATGDLWLSGVAGTPMKRFSATSTWDTFEDPNVQNAYQKASDAEALADAKIKTYAATSAPTGLLATDAGDLWINTTAGSGAISRWSGTAWQLVTDNGTAAANKALADLGINTTWVNTISTQADKAISTFYGSATPTGMAEGDLWLSGVAGVPMKRYTSNAWTNFEDPNVMAAYQKAADAESLADQKVKTFAQSAAPTGLLATDAGDLWIDTDDGKVHRWSGSGWIQVVDNGTAAANAALTALGINQTWKDAISAQADKAITTFYGATTPTGMAEGDLWLTGVAGTPMKRYTSNAWVNFEDPNVMAAYQKAADAESLADQKVKTFAQSGAPTGLLATDAGDLWIDTDDGKVHRWSGSAWIQVVDNGTAAANSALSALGLNQTWVDSIEAQADRAIDTFFGTATPTGMQTGDLWLSGVAGTPMKRWSGTAWDAFEDPNVMAAYQKAQDALLAADDKVRTFAATSAPAGLTTADAGDLWINTTVGPLNGQISRWSGSGWTLVTDNGAAAAAKKTTTWFQDAQPSLVGNTIGDVWFDTNDQNKVYAWNGTIWASARDTGIAALVTSVDGKNTNYWQNDMPSGGTYKLGDLWVDTNDGNKMYAYNGTTFVAAQDAAITTALASANGKNKVHYSTSDASGTVDTTDSNRPYVEGDTWFKRSTVSPFNIIGQWEFTGGAWVTRKISGQVVTELDAGTITVGQLTGAQINATAIDGKTITGATIQTITTASRGIKLTSTELAGYDGAGVKNFSLTSAGALTLKGAIKSGSTIEGATLSAAGGGIETTATANRGVKLKDTGIVTYDAAGNMTFKVDAATGLVEAPGLKANSITGDMIKGGTVTAKNLFVGDMANLATIDELNGITVTSFGQTQIVAGYNKLVTDSGAYLMFTEKHGPVPFSQDDTIYYEFTAKATAPTTAQFAIYTYDAADANTASFTDDLAIGTTDTLIKGEKVVTGYRANATQFVIGLLGVANKGIQVKGVKVYKKFGGQLIVDGAIDGKTITGATVQTSTGATTGIKLTPTELAGWDGTNKNFSLTSAGALTLKGAIQSGSTIEGAKITGTSGLETSTIANTGVKITNTGIKAYDAGNNLSFSVNAATGEVEAPGLKANSIKGDKIESGTILAEKLLIANSANVIVDPAFFNPTLSAYRTSVSAGGTAGWTLDTGTATTMRSYSRTTASTNDQFHFITSPITPGTSQNHIQVSDGQKWSFSVDVETNVAAVLRWNLYLFKSDGTMQYWGLPWNVSATGKRKLTGEYTVPTGVVAIAPAIASNTTGVLWKVYGNAYAGIQANSTLIEPGAITTAHMTAGTIDAGILSAGSIKSPMIEAKSIGVDRLTITSTDNLVVGGDMALGAASWQKTANITANATAGRGSLPTLRFTGTVSTMTSLNLNNRVTVESDNRFRGSIFVKSTSTLAIDKVRLYIRCYTTATAYTVIVGVANTTEIVANTWTQVQGVTAAALPANTIAVEFYLHITNPTTGTITDVDYVSATRASDGTLIVDGAITASKLQTELVLASRIVAGDSDGTHAEMSPLGFRVFADAVEEGAPSTEVVRLGVAGTNDYFAITKSDGSLAASISQDGVGSFASIEALMPDENGVGGLIYGGKEFTNILDERPRGIIAAAYRTTNSGYNAYVGGPFYPYLRVEATLEPGRLYKIWTSPVRTDVDNGVGCTVGIAYNNTTYATVDNGNHFVQGFVQPNSTGGRDSVTVQELFLPIGIEVPTVYSFLLVYGIQNTASGVGAGYAGLRASGSHPVRLVIEDVGPANANIGNGVSLDGTVAPPAPINTYVKRWDAIDSMNYKGDNSQYLFDTGRMYQGLSPAGYGNLKSIALFGNNGHGESITGALSGASINYIRVYFNFEHWYYNSGGTARIGVHPHTSLPGSFTYAGNGQNGGLVVSSGGWPKPGARWVDLPSDQFPNFKNGIWRGIVLEGDTTFGTYGYAQRPIIEISYNK